MKTLIVILLVLVTPPIWAGPSAANLDYSFSRPLLIDSRYVNGFRFDIIRPRDRFEILEDSQWMAEIYADNFLIVRHRGIGVATEVSEGEFSFKIADELIGKFGQDSVHYMPIYEWGGGQVTIYHVYSTEPQFLKILELQSRSDRYGVIAPDQLQFYEPSDIEGLSKCPPSAWPYDTVVYTLYPNKAERHVVKTAEVPECAKP